MGAGRPRGIIIKKAPRKDCGAEYLRWAILSFRPIACIPPAWHIVSCSFLQMGNVSVQPKDISSSAGSVVVGVSDIVSENLPIAEETTAASSIAGQVHSTNPVAIMKAVACAAFRSWLSVVGTKDEF